MNPMDQEPGGRRSGLLSPSRRRGRRRQAMGPAAPGILLALILLPLAVGAGWWWWTSRPGPEASAADAPVGLPHSPDVSTDVLRDAPRAVPSVPPLDLPPLRLSDAFIRQLVARLSANPQWAQWLVSDDLVGRFVLTVVNVAQGFSPAPAVPFLKPSGAFRIRESGGRLFIDPASYRRYDRLTDTFASLDPDAAARLYLQLLPLFDEAYRELGLVDPPFDAMMDLAVANLLAVRVPEGPIEVTPWEGVYEFVDPGVEARTPAEKHLLRMGPDNARRFQAMLADFAGGLGRASPGAPR